MAEPHRDEIENLEALHAANPEGRAFTHLAEAYRRAGEPDYARSLLEDGLERHADYPSAWVVLGRVLKDQGDMGGAADAFRRVIDLDGDNLVALRALGDLHARSGETGQALGYYDQLLRRDPEDEALQAVVYALRASSGGAPAVEEPVVEAPAAEAPVAEEPAPGEPAPEEPAFEEAPVEEPRGEELHGDEGRVDEAHGEAALPEAPPDEPDAAGDVTAEASLPPEPEASAADGSAAAGEPAGDDWPFALEPTVPEPAVPEPRGGAWPFAEEAASDDEDDAETLTSTMAELYLRQGFPERAVEIFRTLVRQHPEDARFAERLADAEAALAGHGYGDRRPAAAGEPEPDAGWGADAAGIVDAPPGTEEVYFAAADEPTEAAPTESGLPWLERVEAAWTGGDGAGAEAPSPFSPAEESADDGDGATVGAYFSALLAWRPGAAETEASPGAGNEAPSAIEPLPEVPSADPWAPEVAGAGDAMVEEPDRLAEPWAADTAQAPEEAEPWAAEAPEPPEEAEPWAAEAPEPPEEVEPWAAEAPEPPEEVDPWAVELVEPPEEEEPWAATPATEEEELLLDDVVEEAPPPAPPAPPAPAPPPPAAPAPSAEPVDEVAAAFAAWYDAGPEAEAAVEPEGGSDSSPRAPEAEGGEPASGEAPADADPWVADQARPAADGAEDEDLDTFRSWLQSLKK